MNWEGAIPNLEIEVYHHEAPGLSKTLIDAIHRSVAHYEVQKTTPREATPAMVLGSAIHQAILEPHDFDKKFMVIEGDGRTAAVKEAKARAAEAGMAILTSDQMQTVLGVKAAFEGHVTAPNIIAEGVPEVSLFWRDEETGLLLKARPDWLNGGDVMDIKTTTDARSEAFSRTIANFRYEVQGAMIQDGMRANGMEMENFLLIALETTAPFCLAVYRLEPEALEFGRRQYRADLQKFLAYQKGGAPAGYDFCVQNINLPRWAYKQDGAIYG